MSLKLSNGCKSLVSIMWKVYTCKKVEDDGAESESQNEECLNKIKIFRLQSLNRDCCVSASVFMQVYFPHAPLCLCLCR